MGRKKRPLVDAHKPPRKDSGAVVLPLRGLCPWDDENVTDYDRKNLALYACLIDGEEQGASLEEIAWVAFRIDPKRSHDWAIRVVTSHLRRAHWIAEHMFSCYDD